MAPLRLPSVAETAAIDIPHAGAFFSLNRAAAYRAAKNGFLPVVQISHRRYKVPVAALREMLGVPPDGGAVELDNEGDWPEVRVDDTEAVSGDE
jgi:hypothetical protein